MRELQPPCGPGDRVVARGARWLVADTASFDQCLVAGLRGADQANAGEHRVLLHPFDRLLRVDEDKRPKRVGRRAWTRELGLLVSRAAPHDCLRAAAAARLDLLAWQIEPALAVVSGLATRLLLADEVGLGKTIQAAFVLAELRARGVADRVLVLTPAGLREQWAEELASRFSIDAAIVDLARLAETVSWLPATINPWSTFPVAIVSLDFIKRAEVLRAIEPLVWDLLVVDEAHTAAAETERARAVRAIACRSRRVLLLTATPHAGDPVTFKALCDTGRLEAIDRVVVFRRTRREVGVGCRRRVHVHRVRLSPDEERMHDALRAYAARVWFEQPDDGPRGARLAMMVLQKRAFSGAASLAKSLRRRISLLAQVETSREFQQSFLFTEDDAAADLEDADREPAGALAVPGLNDTDAERSMLEKVLSLAEQACRRDTKLDRIVRLLRRSREPAIVFTEYRDSAEELASLLATTFPVTLLHGGLDREARNRALGEFRSGRARVLVATDVASEGLNLQESCRLVVNLELPWNPVRLEQRIGRVDRLGQNRTVHAFHLVAGGTGEEAVLARLARRLASIRDALGTVPETLPLPDEAEVAGAIIRGDQLPETASSWPKNEAANEAAESRSAEEAGPDLERAAESLARRAVEEVSRLTLVRRLHAVRGGASRRRERSNRTYRSSGIRMAASVPAASIRRWRLARRLDERSADCWLPACPGLVHVFIARTVDLRHRLVEEHVVPVFLPLDPSRIGSGNRVDLAAMGEALAVAADAARSAAREAARRRLALVAMERAPLETRERRREKSIEREIALHFGRLAGPVQAGLFDRRSLERREAVRSLERSLLEDLKRSAPASAAELSFLCEPELALLLLIV